jgi:maleate isomerase
MAFSSWRGLVGTIKPTMRPGSFEELVRLLPEGIGIVPLFLEGRQAPIDDWPAAIPRYEERIAEMARTKPDIIHVEGATAFMLMGRKAEADCLRKWRRRFKVPIFTAAQNQVRALRVLKIKSLVGITYATGNMNAVYAQYLAEAGFNVMAMAGMPHNWENIDAITPEALYAFAKKYFLKNSGADGIYLHGSDWRVLKAVEWLEQDLGVPVVHAVAARSWELQKRLHVRQPLKGCGRLLRDMP